MSVQLLQEAASKSRFLLEVRKSASRVCLNTVVAWIVRSGQRRALRELAEEGRLLSDIGLTRAQALRESAKPFWRQ